MKTKSLGKPFPELKTDTEAENFVRDADLVGYDFSGFNTMKFEFAHKAARINMRLPEDLLERIKLMADKRDIPYTRFIRQILEAVVERDQRTRAK